MFTPKYAKLFYTTNIYLAPNNYFLWFGIVYGDSQLQVTSCLIPDSVRYHRTNLRKTHATSSPNLEFFVNPEPWKPAIDQDPFLSKCFGLYCFTAHFSKLGDHGLTWNHSL